VQRHLRQDSEYAVSLAVEETRLVPQCEALKPRTEKLNESRSERIPRSLLRG